MASFTGMFVNSRAGSIKQFYGAGKRRVMGREKWEGGKTEAKRQSRKHQKAPVCCAQVSKWNLKSPESRTDPTFIYPGKGFTEYTCFFSATLSFNIHIVWHYHSLPSQPLSFTDWGRDKTGSSLSQWPWKCAPCGDKTEAGKCNASCLWLIYLPHTLPWWNRWNADETSQRKLFYTFYPQLWEVILCGNADGCGKMTTLSLLSKMNFSFGDI